MCVCERDCARLIDRNAVACFLSEVYSSDRPVVLRSLALGPTFLVQPDKTLARLPVDNFILIEFY